MGRHDDLWSLFFVLSEMMNSQLPWRRMMEKDKVKTVKQSTPTSQLWRNFPSETFAFVHHLQQLHFYDTPNYQIMMDSFDAAMRNMKITEQTAYDWETKEDKNCRENVECEDAESLASGKSEEE